MKKQTKQPFRSFMNLDDMIILCPCGASVKGEGKILARKYNHIYIKWFTL